MICQDCRILVIDDLPDNLFLLRSLLQEEGYCVEVADNANSALSLLDEFAPDLILLDVMMPGTNGYELTRKIRQDSDFCTIPIVLVTASTEACRVKGLASGATEFVRKPLDLEELLQTIQRILQYSSQPAKPIFPNSNYDLN